MHFSNAVTLATVIGVGEQEFVQEVEVTGGLLSSWTVVMRPLLLAEGGKPANVDGPHKKHIVSESFHGNLKSHQAENVDQ